MAELLPIAGPVIGGLLGGSQDAPQQSTQRMTDPRFDEILYGKDGKGGFLSAAGAQYAANPSGMNQQQVDGLNMQYGVYSSPANMQGFQNLANLGQSLASQGVAGNPFTNGQMQLRTGGMPAAAPGASPMQQVQALFGGTGLLAGGGGAGPGAMGTGVGAFNPSLPAPSAAAPMASAPGPYSMAPPPAAPAPPPAAPTDGAMNPYVQQMLQQGYGQLPAMTGVNSDLSQMLVLRDMLNFGNGG